MTKHPNESSTKLPLHTKAETENEQSQVQLSVLQPEIPAPTLNAYFKELELIKEPFLEKQHLEIKTIQEKWTDDSWKYIAPERKREIFEIKEKANIYAEAKSREVLLDDIHLEIIRSKINLQSLTLELNNLNLTRLPKALFTAKDLQSFLQTLEVLYLNRNQLTSLPAEIGSLPVLEVLNLNRNQLTTLPAEIGSLPVLKVLGINNNQLTTLPVEIGRLQALQCLELSNNKLERLPAEIGRLPALVDLYLNDNQLTALPAEMGELRTVKFLGINDNQLTALPAEMGRLLVLNALGISNNQLTTLPPEISRLPVLEVLNLNHNQLTERTVRQFEGRFDENWVRETLQTQTNPNLVQAEESSNINNMLRNRPRPW